MSDLFHEQLNALRARSSPRKLREIGTAQGTDVQVVGQKLINFSSNDYLGLANHSLLREATLTAIDEFGVGAGASRLISGTQSPHVRLEAALARWKETPAALTFSSGYAAALGTIPALVGKRDVIFLDKLCHASLIDGAKLSGATIRVFPHNHLGKLESHLASARKEHPDERLLIVTESVSAMDGDRAPLRELINLKKQFNALLLLDEAHAIGVIGAQGRGLADELNLTQQVDVHMGTLSKALGASGGYICGSRALVEWLINRARSFICSTAQPPALAAAATAAIEFLQSSAGEERRSALWKNIHALRAALDPIWTPSPKSPEVSPAAAPTTTGTKLRQLLATMGRLSPKPTVETVDSEKTQAETGSAIHPLIIGDTQGAVDLAQSLQTQGFLVPAIRYPTVAQGSARLRVTVTAAHNEKQIDNFASALRRLRSATMAAED